MTIESVKIDHEIANTSKTLKQLNVPDKVYRLKHAHVSKAGRMAEEQNILTIAAMQYGFDEVEQAYCLTWPPQKVVFYETAAEAERMAEYVYLRLGIRFEPTVFVSRRGHLNPYKG